MGIFSKISDFLKSKNKTILAKKDMEMLFVWKKGDHRGIVESYDSQDEKKIYFKSGRSINISAFSEYVERTTESHHTQPTISASQAGNNGDIPMYIDLKERELDNPYGDMPDVYIPVPSFNWGVPMNEIPVQEPTTGNHAEMQPPTIKQIEYETPLAKTQPEHPKPKTADLEVSLRKHVKGSRHTMSLTLKRKIRIPDPAVYQFLCETNPKEVVDEIIKSILMEELREELMASVEEKLNALKQGE